MTKDSTAAQKGKGSIAPNSQHLVFQTFFFFFLPSCRYYLQYLFLKIVREFCLIFVSLCVLKLVAFVNLGQCFFFKLMVTSLQVELQQFLLPNPQAFT